VITHHNAVLKLRNEWRSTSILGYGHTSEHSIKATQLAAVDGTLYTGIQKMFGSNLG
jgi:hypothetical protein